VRGPAAAQNRSLLEFEKITEETPATAAAA
jgi:hypothetical protein